MMMTSPVVTIGGYYYGMATRRRRLDPLDHLGPETAVIYLRISQDRTGEGLGVERQEKACRDLARRLGLTITGVYTDNDFSATNGKARPEFERMLRERPEGIVCWHQDRLLRMTSDLERVIDLDVPVHTVTAGLFDLTTPTGRGMARTVAAWSTVETEHKAERQRSANVQRAERGHWQFSRRPYGYRRPKGSNVIEIVPEEAEIVRECYRRYNAGESLYSIANDLNAREVPTHNTNAESTGWSMRRVQQMLRNEHYAGIVTYLGERIDAEPTWTPLIDSRTWSDYLAMRDGRTREGAWSTATKHLLSGMIFCGVCGARMLARPDYRRNPDGTRRTFQAYACQEKWCVQIKAEEVEPVVNGIVLARLADKRVLKALRDEPDTAPVVAEITALRGRQRALIDLIADGALPKAEARQRGRQLAERVEALEKRLSAMRRESPLTDLALSRSIPTKWNRKMPLLEKRRVIEDLGLVVTIDKARRGRRPNGPGGKPLPDLDRIRFEWRDAADAEATEV
jgi:DNA invertase Pin-like site-specific DNA recombinase